MDIMMEAEVIRLALEVSKRDAEITQLRAELAAERELAADLCFTLSAFVAKYGGTNAARQVKDYRDHCATRRNK